VKNVRITRDDNPDTTRKFRIVNHNESAIGIIEEDLMKAYFHVIKALELIEQDIMNAISGIRKND